MLASALAAVLLLPATPATCRMTAELRQIASTTDGSAASRRAAVLLAEQGKWRAAATAQESAGSDEVLVASYTLRSGDVDRADALLADLSEKQRATSAAHMVAADIAIERDDADTAAEELEAARASSDGGEIDALLRARIALLRDDASTAMQLLRGSKTPDGRLYYARALNAAGQTAEAVRVLEDLAGEFPPCAGVRREHALFEAALFASDTDAARAERLYGEAIDAAEEQEVAFSAAIREAKVNLQQPVTGLFVAAMRDPRQAAPESRNNLGHLLIARADGDVATLALAQAELRNAAESRDYATPEYAYIGLARAALAAGDREAAAEEVTKALWRAPLHDEAIEIARSLIRDAPTESRLGVGVVFNMVTAEALPPRFIAREYGRELAQLEEFASRRDDALARKYSATYALATHDFERARALAADARARFSRSAWPDAIDFAALTASGKDEEARMVLRTLQTRIAEDPPRTSWDAATLRPALASSRVFPWEPTPGLTGRVAAGNDPLGIPGTTITVFTEDGPRTVVSDAEGRWRLRDLPPGSYSVLAELAGMQTAGRIESVTSGETEVQIALDTAGVSENIAVTGDAPLVDPLPQFNRIYDFTSPTPVYSAALISGASSRENAYVVDGVNVTDVFGLATNDVPFSSAIHELQIQTSGFSAEYGLDRVPYVTAFSLSGTNDFNGKVVMEAGRDTEAAEPVTMPHALADDREQEILRMNAGGPVRRDVLRWFFSADLQRERGRSQAGDSRGHRFDLFGKLSSSSVHTSADLSARVLDTGRSGVVDDPGGSAFGTASSVDRRQKVRDDTFALTIQRLFGPATMVIGTASRTNARSSLRPGSAEANAMQLRFPELGFFTTGGVGFINDGRRSERTGAQLKVDTRVETHDLVGGVDVESSDDAVSDRISGGMVIEPEPAVSRYWTYGDDPHLAAAIHESFASNEASAFVNDTWTLGRLTLVGGLRWTRQHARFPRDVQLTTSAFQPRLGIAFNPDGADRWKIYSSYARFFQSLQRDELVAYGSDRRYVFAPEGHSPIAYGRVSAVDPNLRARSSDVLDAGAEYGRTPWKWSAGVQYQRLASHIDDFLCTDDNRRCIGNPGRGLLSELPRAKRELLSLFAQILRNKASSSWELNYRWLRSEANTEPPDLASTRVIGIDPYARPAFDNASLVSTGDLPLPTHLLTASAFKTVEDLISTHDVVFSATLTAQSGLPRGAFGYSPLYGRHVTTEVPRGEERDGSAVISLHAGVEYGIPIAKSTLKLSLVGRNLIGSQTSRVDDQRADLPTFLRPIERNEPRSLRALVTFAF